MRWNMRDIISTFRDETILHLPPVAVLPTILYVHMRSESDRSADANLRALVVQFAPNQYLVSCGSAADLSNGIVSTVWIAAAFRIAMNRLVTPKLRQGFATVVNQGAL
jgi:hypothetical protein